MQHVDAVLTGDRRIARQDAGGDDHLVKPLQHRRRARCPSFIVMPVCATIVRYQSTSPQNSSLPGICLAMFNCPPISSPVKQGHAVPAFGGGHALERPAGPAPTTAMDLGRVGRRDRQFGFIAGARVHQADRDLAAKGVVEAGLVAGDAGRDRVSACPRLPCSRNQGRPASGAPSTPCRRSPSTGPLRRPRAC